MKKLVFSNKGRNAWPSAIVFETDESKCLLRVTVSDTLSDWRAIDPFAFACFRSQFENEGKTIEIHVPKSRPFERESLCRRLSYLSCNNKDLEVRLYCGNSEIGLYPQRDLIKRPEDEVTYSDLRPRNGEDVPGRPEKDLQVWLFNERLVSETKKPNVRLGILGQDFYKLTRPFGWTREFPTGVFKKTVARNTRILPTNFIDLIAFNTKNQLAIVELKFNDNPLELIAQSLDYALFVMSYMKQVSSALEIDFKALKRATPDGWDKKPFVVYMVNNTVHPKWDQVFPYYLPQSDKWGFELKHTILGCTCQPE